MSPTVRVLLVDDHRMFREGVRRCIEAEQRFVVVGEASTADEAIAILEAGTPDVMIVDIRMPGRSGIDLAREVRRRWPALKLLVLSGYDFDQYVRALLRIGIEGYLIKDAPQEELVQALHQIADGGVVLPPKIASTVVRTYSTRSNPGGGASHEDELTTRELEILEGMFQGLKNSEIAERYGISARTAETHVGRILTKLGAHTRTEAVRIAVERGLVK